MDEASGAVGHMDGREAQPAGLDLRGAGDSAELQRNTPSGQSLCVDYSSCPAGPVVQRLLPC